MENEINLQDFDAVPVDPGEKRNILEEINQLNREMANQKKETFRKTTYWHQLSSADETVSSMSLLQDITQRLTKIESALSEIKVLLEK